MPPFLLENDLLRAEFDPQTGALVAFVSRATGWPIHRRPELGRSFRLLVPLPGRRNNPVLGERQAPPRAAFDAAARRLAFTWDRLASEHGGTLDLTFSETISYEPRNFKGRLDEFPLTIEYGKRVDALRRRYAEWLWHADFCDTLGAAVTAGGQAHNGYSVFRHRGSGKRAVVVANYDSGKSSDVQVALDEAGRVATVITPENPDPRPNAGAAQLPPRSAAVFLEG